MAVWTTFIISNNYVNRCDMKFKEALDIINFTPAKGFMVSFEWKKGCIPESDYFPDKHEGEELIETEGEAWRLAEKFAEKMKGKCVNIYVIDETFSPVDGYEKRRIENRT